MNFLPEVEGVPASLRCLNTVPYSSLDIAVHSPASDYSLISSLKASGSFFSSCHRDHVLKKLVAIKMDTKPTITVPPGSSLVGDRDAMC